MTPDRQTERILLLTPTGRDGPMIAGVLSRAGLAADVCRDMAEFCGNWNEGAGAGVIAEEALAPRNRESLIDSLTKQPVWSDFPLVVLTGGGHTTKASTTIAQALETCGNVTLLERPLRFLTLISAIQSALRARHRQYEVRKLLEETHQAVEQREVFLAMLAHELRNPLAPIRNSLQVLRIPNLGSAVIEQAREIADRQVQHMARLLEDLLDVSRISRGKIELRKEAVDLGAVARNTAEAVRPDCQTRHQELRVEFSDEPLLVEGDATRLEQVLTNLLSNAVKYTDPGGKVSLTGGREGGQVVLRVRDNGIGIAPDKLARIFDLFTQIERRLDRSQGGLGIGLTLVQKLAAMHGGTVEARSEGLGCGTEFIVRLPALVRAGANGSNGPAEGSATTSLASCRVLVVDDNIDAADSLGMFLRLTGQQVRVVYDGPTALTAAHDFLPQVVVLDLGMPAMDGFTVARLLRVQPGFRDVVFIAVTGWGNEEDKRRSREAGFDHHLVKPVDPEDLQRLLGPRGGGRKSSRNEQVPQLDCAP